MLPLARIEKLVILKFLAWLASRDGKISPQEIFFLEDISRQMGIDPLPPLDKLLERKAPYKILHHLKSRQSKRWLLKLLVQISFADGVYDSRERLAAIATASALGFPKTEVEDIERELVETLHAKLVSLSPEKTTEPKSWDWRKIASIAGTSVAGGAALAVTGGLVAPVIGGAIGTTLFGLSGAAASSAGLAFLGGGSIAAGGAGMAGGTALVSTVLGACGVGTAGWKTKHLLGDLKEWEIQHVGGRGLHVYLGIGGFLQQNEDHAAIWSPLQRAFPKACSYTLAWESQTLRKLFEVFSAVFQKGVVGTSIAVAARSATKKAFGFATLPLALLLALEAIDNPWFVAKNRADRAGELLGDWIADNRFGGLPVTLVGYSLGARVIIAAIARLAERNAFGKIYDVYFLGGAIAKNDPRLQYLRRVVAGRIVNGYSRKDLILTYLYRTAELLAKPIGIGELGLDGALDIDLTETVGGHLNYPQNLGYILSRIAIALGTFRS